MWGGRRETSFTGMPNLVKKNNGNFAAVFVNGVIEFDKDLNVMERMSFNSGTGLFCRRLCYLNDNTPVLAGLQSSGLFYAKLNNTYQTNCTSAPTVLITPFNDVNQNNFNISYHPYNII